MQFLVNLENFQMVAHRFKGDGRHVPVIATSNFYGDDVNITIETNFSDHGVPSDLMCVGEQYRITIERLPDEE